MSIFIATELMFFVALISAYLVIKAATGNWVPPENIRLPVMATGFNTAILILSGWLTYRSGKLLVLGRSYREQARSTFLRAIVLGGFFVLFQGYEWVNLITHGMTMKSSIFGACFFLLIGSHGLHALATIVAMLLYYRHLTNGTFTLGGFRAVQMIWLFVVGIWPILYGLVYF
jgi:heme/copper-type cytochrome/quinol oxidase subunit 3